MALGQEPAADLWQAATTGQFVLEPDAARELAGHYEWFADEMVQRQQEMTAMQRLAGFGSLRSAQHLQQGFEGKAHQAFDAYKTAEESAHRMAAAIYRAANLTQDVDAANAAAIHAASKEIPDAQT